jgi:hypothetical protein
VQRTVNTGRTTVASLVLADFACDTRPAVKGIIIRPRVSWETDTIFYSSVLFLLVVFAGHIWQSSRSFACCSLLSQGLSAETEIQEVGRGLSLADTQTGRYGRTWNGNPLVDVRTGAGHADVRLGGLWNRHVWKKDTRARAGRFIKYQNR